MLDIHLFKGTELVFMDYMRKFMYLIELNCECIFAPQITSPYSRKGTNTFEEIENKETSDTSAAPKVKLIL